MKRSITIMAFLCLIFQANAQQTQIIKGNVTDVQSSFPLIGATVTVTIAGNLQGSVTDLEGNFRIEQVPVGRHTLQVSYIGYEEKSVSNLEVTSGKEVIVNISLLESLHQLDAVVISAAKQQKGETPNEMAAVSALSFSVEETGRYAAAFDDPARAALSFPGVKGGGDDIMNEIVIRGNSPRGLLWRLEGIEIPNPNHFGEVGSSAGGISMLSNNVITKTDFYTGAFPAEYGNPTSGIMDISLRSGNNDKREYAFEASVIGLQASAEGPFKEEGKGSYLVNYRYSTLSLLDKVLNFNGGQESTVFQDLSFKLMFPNTKLGTFSVWGFGGANGQEFNANEESAFNENWKVRSGAGGVRHTVFVDEKTFIETGFSITGNTNRWSLDSLKAITYGTEDFKQLNKRLSVTANRKFNSAHTVKTGMIYSNLGFDMLSRYYHKEEARHTTDLDDSGTAGRWQGFGQWQYRVSENLTFNTGVHYTQIGLSGQSSLEPRFGAKYQLNEKQHVSAGAGIHSRMETVAIYLAQQEEGDTYIQPNKSLDLSKAAHFVVGYENRSISNMRFRAEAYYQKLYDVPVMANAVSDWEKTFSSLNSADGYTTYRLSNEGAGQNYGIELLAERYLNDGFYYLFTGSLYKSLYTNAEGIEFSTKYDGGYVLNALGGKEFQLKNDKTLGLNGRIILQGANRFTPINVSESIDQGYTSNDWTKPYSGRLNDYFRIDFGIKYTINKPNHTSIISLNVQNVTARLNEYDRFYDPETSSVQSWEQMGILPVLSYRVLF